MTLWQWLTLAGVCLAGAASPGPSLAVVLQANLAGGRAAGLSAAWAHALGVGVYALLTVLGFSLLLTTMPALFSVLQVAAALYLFYLAWKLVSGQPSPASGTERLARVRAARDGFSVALLNPKLGLFMLALFSQFLSPQHGFVQHAILVLTATLIDGGWYSLVTLLVGRPGWLDTLRRRAVLLDRVLAALLTVVALTLLLRTFLDVGGSSL